jgi:hypothetical protein
MNQKSIIGKSNRIEEEITPFEEVEARILSYKESDVRPTTYQHNTESSDNIISKPSNIENLDKYIYVPSVNIYVAKQLTHLGKDWYESQKLLQQNNQRMITIPEFIEFLNCLKSDLNNREYLEIYRDITELKGTNNSEWLDARFGKNTDNTLNIRFHKYQSNSNNNILASEHTESLEDKTMILIRNKTTISLDDYLQRKHTAQGLPTTECDRGSLYYVFPSNNSVATFEYETAIALNCSQDPSWTNQSLGVRAVKIKS